MATKINVDINVSDNGTTKKSTDAAERLKKTYDAAAKSASKIGASPTMAGASSRATSSAELVEYNRNRALSTGTGASARDFAKQSEGLGGLVRLYATFAANIFAVTAAFGALSSAMDTTNMIRGLDQLGASTGVNLGGLSKRLVETTGNAVSLREAMEATVKASAAGIDSSSILRLGKVAQQASVALGVNAADALNRLSRGVVKLEPELLDELGIFTKIDPAVKKYAESVNKAVGELTDFERRQAFLNAVIEEGEQKFSQIEIDTNPYTKLSAALQNTLQNALELVNKGLGPVANFLAESPGALTASLIALGTVLVKQALPALGQVREGLRKTAEEAAEAASGKAGDAVQARGILQDLLVKQVQKATDEQIQLVDESEKRILELKNGRISKQSALYALMKKDIQDVEDADIEAAKKQLAGMGNRTAAQKALRLETENFIRQVEKLREAHDREYAQGKKQLESTYIYRKVQEDALKFEIKAKQDSMISNAAYTSSLLGPTAGWRRLRAEIELADLSLDRFQKTALLARGALAIVGSAIASVADKIGKLLFYIGIVTTAWTALNAFFSTKEIAAFSSSVSDLDSTTENLAKTFQRVKQVNPFGQESFKAQSNALMEFSNGLTELSLSADRAFKSLQKSQLAQTKDVVFRFFGGGSLKEFQTALSNNLASAFSEIDDSAIKKNLEQKLKKILNLTSSEALDVDNINKKLEQLNIVPGSAKAKELSQAYKDAAIEAGILASRIEEVKNANKEATSAANALKDSYKIKNPIIEFAEQGIAALSKLSKAMEGTPEQFAEALEDTFKTLQTTPLFGPDLSKRLATQAEEVSKGVKALRQAQIEIADPRTQVNLAGFSAADQQKLDDLKQKIKEFREQNPKLEEAAKGKDPKSTPAQNLAKIQADEATVKKLEAARAAAITGSKEASKSLVSAVSEAQRGIATGMKYFVGLIAKELNVELGKNKNKFLEGLLGQIDFIPGLAEQQVDLKIQELNTQKIQLESQRKLFVALTTLEATIALQTAEEKAKKDPTNVANQAALARARTTKNNLEQVIGNPGSLQNIENPTPELASAATQSAAFIAKGIEQNQTGQLLGLDRLLAKEKDKLNLQLRSLELNKTYLEIRDKTVETEKLSGRLNEESYLTRVQDIKQQLINLDNTKKIAEIESKQNSDLIKAGQLTNEKDKKEAITNINKRAEQEKTLANTQKELETKKLQINTDLQLLDIAVRKTQAALALKRITEETENIKAQSNLKNRGSTLDVQTRTNKLSREGLLNATKQLALDRIAQKEKEDLQVAGATLIEDQIALGQKLSAAIITNNKEEEQSIIAQIIARNEKYNALVGSIKRESAALAESARLDIGEKRAQLLQNELDLRRQIEDISTGTTTVGKDRELLQAESELEVRRTILKIDEESYIKEKAALAQKRSAVDFEKQRQAVVTETNRQIEDSENRKKAAGNIREIVELEDVRQKKIKENAAAQIGYLYEQQRANYRLLDTTTKLELIELRNKRATAARTVLDLENQIAQVKASSAERASRDALELARRQNKIAAQQIKDSETKTLTTSIDTRLANQKKVLDDKYSAEKQALEIEYDRLSETGIDSKASMNIIERLSLLKKLYEQETKTAEDGAKREKDIGLLDIQNKYLALLGDERSIKREIEDLVVGGSAAAAQFALQIEEDRLEALKQSQSIEESRYIARKALVDQAKLELDIENRRNSIKTAADRQVQDIEARIAMGNLTPTQAEDLQKLIALVKKEQTEANRRLDTELGYRKDILNTTTEIALQDALRTEKAKELTDQYKEMSDVAKLIGDVFDGFGDRFAETVSKLSTVLQTDLDKRNALETEYNKKKREALTAYGGDAEAASKDILKLEEERLRKTATLELETATTSISGVKGLFKEKTTAYKALTALEKASAVVTLALNAQIIASNLLAIPTNIANGVSRLFAQLGVGGFAASAAFLALMATVFRGSPKGSFGPSLQQIQESQTTGQTYRGDVLVTRKGALAADPTKTLESLDQSLQIIKEYNFDELEFSNKNKNTLEKIEQNTKGLAEALALESLAIDLQGKNFKKEGFSLGTVGGALGAGALGALAFGPIGILGAAFAKPFNKLLGSIFGGKTTQTVKNFGVIVSGSLSSLTDANTALVQTFTDLEVLRKGGLFKSDKLSVIREPLQEANDLITEYVSVLFGDVKNSFLNSAEILGTDVSSVVEKYVIEPLEISIKDLSPEEIADAIKNQISSTLNELALTSFGSLISALRDPLEEAGTTLTRLSSQVTLFDQAMTLIGKSVENITGTLKVVVADDLIELVGGVESFKEKISFFRENFLTEAEQIAPIAEALTKELEALGISASLTRDQFKALVLSQDSAPETVAALLNVAEAFDKVTSAAEEAQSKLNGFLKDIRDFIREQTLSSLPSIKNTTALLTEFNSTLTKSLQGDEKSLETLTDIASQTIESARNSSKTFSEFNLLRAGILNGLDTVASKIESGDLKILTPQEQANVLLEEIATNTGTLAQDLAKEIDRQAAIREIVSSPEAAADALALTVAQAIQESSYEFSLDPKTVAFLEEERRQQDIADELGIPEKGPLSIRMGAVDQLLGAFTPGGSAARIGEAIQTGDISKLAPDLSKVTLSNLGIRAPSVDEFIFSVSQASKTVELGATVLAGKAINAIDAIKNTVNSLIDAVTGNNTGETYYDPISAGDGRGGDGMGGSNPSRDSAPTSGPAGNYGYALGAAFNKGIKMFADGGAFTNSVISNPTMFPLGVMGEAGPEAIMPLTRMGDGSLGVEARTSNTRNDAALIAEIQKLRQEVQGLRAETRVSAVSGNKTFRLLERVTRNGESMQVVDVTPA